MDSKAHVSERGLGVAVAALGLLGLYLVHVGIGHGFGSEPTIVPIIATGGIALLGLAMAIRGAAMEDAEALRGLRPLQALGAVLVVGLHALLLSWIGFLVSGITLQLCLFFVLGVRSVIRSVVISVSVSAVLYYAISGIFGVPLPTGLIW